MKQQRQHFYFHFYILPKIIFILNVYTSIKRVKVFDSFLYLISTLQDRLTIIPFIEVLQLSIWICPFITDDSTKHARIQNIFPGVVVVVVLVGGGVVRGISMFVGGERRARGLFSVILLCTFIKKIREGGRDPPTSSWSTHAQILHSTNFFRNKTSFFAV